MIGAGWTTAVDAAGRRRLDDPNDLVVSEIRAALEQWRPSHPGARRRRLHAGPGAAPGCPARACPAKRRAARPSEVPRRCRSSDHLDRQADQHDESLPGSTDGVRPHRRARDTGGLRRGAGVQECHRIRVAVALARPARNPPAAKALRWQPPTRRRDRGTREQQTRPTFQAQPGYGQAPYGQAAHGQAPSIQATRPPVPCGARWRRTGGGWGAAL